MVQFLSKSIKLFRIYRKMKYLTYDFDIWQGHKILFNLLICIYGPKEEEEQQLHSFDCSPLWSSTVVDADNT